MSTNTLDRTDAGGGEDWWRDIDNTEATATLTAANMTNVKEVKGVDGAMELFETANRKMLQALLERQGELQQTAGQLALNAGVGRGIYN